MTEALKQTSVARRILAGDIERAGRGVENRPFNVHHIAAGLVADHRILPQPIVEHLLGRCALIFTVRFPFKSAEAELKRHQRLSEIGNEDVSGQVLTQPRAEPVGLTRIEVVGAPINPQRLLSMLDEATGLEQFATVPQEDGVDARAVRDARRVRQERVSADKGEAFVPCLLDLAAGLVLRWSPASRPR